MPESDHQLLAELKAEVAKLDAHVAGLGQKIERFEARRGSLNDPLNLARGLSFGMVTALRQLAQVDYVDGVDVSENGRFRARVTLVKDGQHDRCCGGFTPFEKVVVRGLAERETLEAGKRWRIRINRLGRQVLFIHERAQKRAYARINTRLRVFGEDLHTEPVTNGGTNG